MGSRDGPGAKILLVETPTSEDEGTSGFPQIVAAELYVLRHHLGDVISQSFGATEQTFPTAQALLALRTAYVAAAASTNNVTVLAASGDFGATDVGPDGSTIYDFQVSSWPDTDPLVTAVGGTQLHLDAAGNRTSLDTVWNETYDAQANKTAGSSSPNPLASGGGKSVIFERPSYQNRVAPIVGQHRGVPDVSMSAACNGAVDTYQSFGGQAPGWYPSCGTSVATPLFAGIVALADQEAGHPLGPINTALYALSASRAPGIVDITKGNNTVSFMQDGKLQTVKGFPAVRGYDLASGSRYRRRRQVRARAGQGPGNTVALSRSVVVTAPRFVSAASETGRGAQNSPGRVVADFPAAAAGGDCDRGAVFAQHRVALLGDQLAVGGEAEVAGPGQVVCIALVHQEKGIAADGQIGRAVGALHRPGREIGLRLLELDAAGRVVAWAAARRGNRRLGLDAASLDDAEVPLEAGGLDVRQVVGDDLEALDLGCGAVGGDVQAVGHERGSTVSGPPALYCRRRSVGGRSGKQDACRTGGKQSSAGEFYPKLFRGQGLMISGPVPSEGHCRGLCYLLPARFLPDGGAETADGPCPGAPGSESSFTTKNRSQTLDRREIWWIMECLVFMSLPQLWGAARDREVFHAERF